MSILINTLLAVVALALTIFLLRKKVNLGLVMLMDSAFIALIAKIPVEKSLDYFLAGALSKSTIKLIIILFLIMMLENIMRNTGMISEIVENLKELTGGNRLASAILPATLGLLPSPGGARFSCPMVEEVTKENTSSMNKAYINYWFRHVWLDGFILYPGVILAAELMQVSVISFFMHLIPFMLVSVVIGTITGLSGVKKEEIARTKPFKKSITAFLTAMLPILIVITAYVLLIDITPYSLEIASGGVVAALLIIKRYTLKGIAKTAGEAFPVKLVIIIFGVMVFKEFVLNSGAITALSNLLNTYGIPPAVLFLLLPFAGGFTSGITVSFVSLTFPILIPLGLDKSIWYAVIAFTAGTIGNMFTPLHLCAVMTADYYHVSLSKLLRKVSFSEIPMMVLVVAILAAMIM
ncbi:MAG: DUF401 family protein [Clostridiaceae bacterium]